MRKPAVDYVMDSHYRGDSRAADVEGQLVAKPVVDVDPVGREIVAQSPRPPQRAGKALWRREAELHIMAILKMAEAWIVLEPGSIQQQAPCGMPLGYAFRHQTGVIAEPCHIAYGSLCVISYNHD